MPISLGIGTSITMGGGAVVAGYPANALAWQGATDILVWSTTATDYLIWS